MNGGVWEGLKIQSLAAKKGSREKTTKNEFGFQVTQTHKRPVASNKLKTTDSTALQVWSAISLWSYSWSRREAYKMCKTLEFYDIHHNLDTLLLRSLYAFRNKTRSHWSQITPILDITNETHSSWLKCYRNKLNRWTCAISSRWYRLCSHVI